MIIYCQLIPKYSNIEKYKMFLKNNVFENKNIIYKKLMFQMAF